MIKYHPELYGCVSPEGYGYTPIDKAVDTLPRTKGRARKVLKSTHLTYDMTLRMTMTDAQFAGWQTFWANIGYGSEPFHIDLIVTTNFEEWTVQPKAPFNANYSAAGIWDVSVPVEAIP